MSEKNPKIPGISEGKVLVFKPDDPNNPLKKILEGKQQAASGAEITQTVPSPDAPVGEAAAWATSETPEPTTKPALTAEDEKAKAIEANEREQSLLRALLEKIRRNKNRDEQK